MCVCVLSGGEEGEGGRGGRGRGEGARGAGRRDFGTPLPQTAQIHWRRRNFTAGPWGSFMGSHREGPPPPRQDGSLGWVSGEGIKTLNSRGLNIMV